MRIYALIPARSGSKGLPDKNIMDIDGHPLIAYAVMIRLLQQLPSDSITRLAQDDQPEETGSLADADD